MLTWGIRAAVGSGLFDDVVISTDDPATAQVALSAGAHAPFARPAELADDYTGIVPVMAHAARALGLTGRDDALCCLYATAPFISASDLSQGLRLLEGGDWEYVVAAVEFHAPIQRAFASGERGEIRMVQPDSYSVRSQDLESHYHDAGQWCWGRAASWLAERPMLGPHSTYVNLPAWRAVDIDTEEDWARAEMIRNLGDLLPE
jgi:pseudaminic acid cytidylyltransferase